MLVLLVEGPPRRSGPESVRGPRLLRLHAASVRGFEVEAGARRLVAVRTPGGWRLDGRPASPGAAEALDAFVDALARLRAVDAFRPRDRGALGLAPPAATITIHTARHERQIKLGGTNASGSSVYAERQGHPRVFLVGTGLLSAIDRLFYQQGLVEGSANPAR